MDILDTGTDSQTRFLDSRNYGINILKNTDIDLEKQKRAANSLACGESEEEDLSGVGMRVCFKVSSRLFISKNIGKTLCDHPSSLI